MKENFKENNFELTTVLNEIGMVLFDLFHEGWKWSTGTKNNIF